MLKDVVALAEFNSISFWAKDFGLGLAKVNGVLQPIKVDAITVVFVGEIHKIGYLRGECLCDGCGLGI